MEEPNRRSRPRARVICRWGQGPRSQGPAEQEAGRDQGLGRETGLGAELRTQAERQGQAGERGGVRSCHVDPTEAGEAGTGHQTESNSGPSGDEPRSDLAQEG